MQLCLDNTGFSNKRRRRNVDDSEEFHSVSAVLRILDDVDVNEGENAGNGQEETTTAEKELSSSENSMSVRHPNFVIICKFPFFPREMRIALPEQADGNEKQHQQDDAHKCACANQNLTFVFILRANVLLWCTLHFETDFQHRCVVLGLATPATSVCEKGAGLKLNT
ncbi:hypothetical protein MAR_038120 [Mya arenaria]|uniref:Uncharacterized protein n=1 Tax=Mya arenaria TaxID=6604 RepID=A0ABY7FUC4_MYAAR|nr:hypothetical protein MAR_038120 [Mya arenaria]